jgi:hypothetical protein
VSTGLSYPAKAERARRNPKAALLYADPIGSASAHLPVVLVQGHAAVRDADLQANTDSYTRATMAKLPEATKGQPKFLLKRMKFYYARIWIEIVPQRILWWDSRELANQPRTWVAESSGALSQSDPAPSGSQPAPWLSPPEDWRPIAARALRELDRGVGAGRRRPGLRVERALADWSATGNRAQVAIGFLRKGRLLAPRLRDEAARRGQAVPEVRLP